MLWDKILSRFPGPTRDFGLRRFQQGNKSGRKLGFSSRIPPLPNAGKLNMPRIRYLMDDVGQLFHAAQIPQPVPIVCRHGGQLPGGMQCGPTTMAVSDAFPHSAIESSYKRTYSYPSNSFSTNHGGDACSPSLQ